MFKLIPHSILEKKTGQTGKGDNYQVKRGEFAQKQI